MAASRKAAARTASAAASPATPIGSGHQAAASSQGLRKGIRVTGDQRKSVTTTVRRRYLAGETIRSLADDLGRSYGFVHRILVDAGVQMRGRGGATRGRRRA